MVIVEGRQSHHRAEQRPGVDPVQEAVPGVRVLLDVVLDIELGERRLQALGSAREGTIAPTVAGDDRTRSGEAMNRLLWDLAVVDRGRRERIPRRTQQREASAHAEADHADLPGAVLAIGEPSACGLAVLLRRPRAPSWRPPP